MEFQSITNSIRQWSTSPARRVVILGGGFGGLSAARQLESLLVDEPDLEVMLICREDYLLFTPMLHEVAAGDLDPADIVSPLRKLVRQVWLVEAEVTDIDLNDRVVRYTVGGLKRQQVLSYDYLLIALGSESNYFGMQGVEEVALTMKTLTDAALLRNRTVALLEEATQESDEGRRRRLLTFVVAGGGFAGVETVGALNDFLRDTLRYYPELDESWLRVVLVHSGGMILPELGEQLGAYALSQLQKRGVEVMLESRVTGYLDEAVRLASGDSIGCLSLVWTAGVRPSEVIERLPVVKVGGRIKVDEFLQVHGHQSTVWAVGDCAAVPDGQGGYMPPTAQHGIRAAVAAARNIESTICAEPLRPFKFSTLGQLASIGHHTGVARVFGFCFSGFIAWWMWRSLYWSKLPGVAKKARVAVKWTLDLFFGRQIEQLVTLRDVERIERLSAGLRASRHHSEQAPEPHRNDTPIAEAIVPAGLEVPHPERSRL